MSCQTLSRAVKIGRIYEIGGRGEGEVEVMGKLLAGVAGLQLALALVRLGRALGVCHQLMVKARSSASSNND